MGYFTASESDTTNWDFVTKSQKKSTSNSGSDTCSEASFNLESPNLPQLPKDVSTFFSTITQKGYPQKKTGQVKAQPWLKVWEGIVEPDSKGELLVACPKKCDFGSNLGGY